MMAPSRRSENGFSLVELMVAMVIALILIAGVLQILLGNRESFRFQQNMATLQENSRLATFLIENVVAHAGYRADLGANPFHGAEAESTRGVSITRDAVVGGNTADSQNDVLRIRFQAAGGVHDCQGREIGEGGTTPTYETADVDLYVNDQNTLLCADNTGEGNLIPQPVIEHVERFKIRYGVDINGDKSTDTYTNAPPTDPDRAVVSLRIQMLLRSESNVLSTPIRRTYSFADGDSFTTTVDTPADDRHAYQLIDQLIALRNVLP